MNQELRALFPITQKYVYLNHAAVSPPPIPVIAAVQEQLLDVQSNGVLNYKGWLGRKEKARGQVAKLLNSRPEQVAFMRNTSDALSTIANGYAWRPGDNVVTFQREFPSNIYPWLRLRDEFGVEVRMCPERNGRIDADELLSLTDDRTRVVALSWVQYSSGFRSDLARIGEAVRKRDALFVVDVIQGLGVLPIDVEAQFVDVAAGACHKWLLAPEGIGLLYISDRARDRIQPTLTGWVSVREPEKYDDFGQELKISTLPWETGTGPTSLFYGLHAGLNILSEYGTEKCAAYLDGLTDYLCEGLQSRGHEIVSSRSRAEKSQIVSIKPKHNTSAMSLYARLKSEGIIVAPRGERIRFSPHIYNDRTDIDRLMSSLP